AIVQQQSNRTIQRQKPAQTTITKSSKQSPISSQTEQENETQAIHHRRPQQFNKGTQGKKLLSQSKTHEHIKKRDMPHP
ncbi:unnamed protein product, partial [Ilex paraguariensis]